MDERHGNSMGALWFFSALVLMALFISAAAQGELTPGHLLITVMILGLDVAGTLYFLARDARESEPGKTKRRDVETLLDNLSDEELRDLKQRLAALDTPRSDTLDYLDDDGEMVLRR